MSKLYKIDWKDFLKGLILGVGTPVLYYLQELIPTLSDLSTIAKIAISAFIAYVIKNFLQDSDGNILGKTEDIGGGGIKNPPKP
jgi:hypothetical protein